MKIIGLCGAENSYSSHGYTEVIVQLKSSDLGVLMQLCGIREWGLGGEYNLAPLQQIQRTLRDLKEFDSGIQNQLERLAKIQEVLKLVGGQNGK